MHTRSHMYIYIPMYVHMYVPHARATAQKGTADRREWGLVGPADSQNEGVSTYIYMYVCMYICVC